MGKILIIEDDPLVARMYQKALSLEKLSVVVARNGQEGIKKAEEVKPDLILLDIMMPEMNGIEALEALKSDNELKSVPVIMLTNLSGTQDAELALKKGAVAYMVKSEYKPKEVVEKVKQVLAKRGSASDSEPSEDELKKPTLVDEKESVG